MWLSEKAGRGAASPAVRAKAGPVTIGGSSAAVLLSGEQRGLKVLAPAGVAWQPETGSQVLVLETEDGERFILGAAVEADAPAAGQLRLRCGSASLTLDPGGNVWVTGQLWLNGQQITADREV